MEIFYCEKQQNSKVKNKRSRKNGFWGMKQLYQAKEYKKMRKHKNGFIEYKLFSLANNLSSCCKMVLLMFCLAMAFSAVASELRIEGKDFQKLGQWKLIFKNVILFSAVKGDDNVAICEWSIPDGTYHIWVRTFSHGGEWRKATLYINGEKIGTVGDEKLPKGVKGPAWKWTKITSPLKVTTGNIKIELKATSALARIGSFIFSSDDKFVPPEKSTDKAETPSNKKTTPRVTAGQVDIHKNSPLETIFRRPLLSGNGPRIMLFCGGRPWVGNEFAGSLNKCGASTMLINSVYLDGQGGAPIKAFPTDKIELVPLDGITPAFAELDKYKVFIVNAIPRQNQQNIFTKERIKALKKYVKNGGALLVTIDIPVEFGELLPVRLGGNVQPVDGDTVYRPESEKFDIFPASWPTFNVYRKAELKDGGRIISAIKDASGKDKGIFIAEKTYGKGKVIFLNAQLTPGKGIRNFWNWAYVRAFFPALAAEAGNFKLDVSKSMISPGKKQDRKMLGKVKVKITEPILKLTDAPDNVKIIGNTAVFADNIKITAKQDGSLMVFHPDAAKTLLSFTPPAILKSVKQAEFKSATAEAVDIKEEVRKIETKWIFSGITSTGNTAVFNYSSRNGNKATWEFKSASLNLDGCKFLGIAQRIKIVKSPFLISSLELTGKIYLSGVMRRMSCYMPPRGYAEFDFSGAKNTDSSRWGFFASGQPFSWLAGPAGIYSGFIAKPFAVAVKFDIRQGEKAVTSKLHFKFGRLKAPIETPYYYQMFAKSTEHRNNEYIAMWQFQRKNLRAVAGLKEIPAVPMATYVNTTNNEEKEKSIAIASKLGFKYFRLPYCPTALEKLDSTKCMDDYALIKKYGMKAFPWTPLNYSHGKTEKIYNNTSWYMRDEKGKIFKYFGKFPVLDLSNRNFLAWYYALMGRIINAGIGGLYCDMGGAAAYNVDFAKPEAKTGLTDLISVLKFFNKKGMLVGIEGMNPLVLDDYWYRRNKYTPFDGREFALLGALLFTNQGDDLALDFFRLAMYGAFPTISIDGYANGFERMLGEIKMIERIGKLLPSVNAALDVTGMPYIRETEFGTMWVGKNGGALFFWDGAESVTLDLPKGWRIRDQKGNKLEHVKPDTIVILDGSK